MATRSSMLYLQRKKLVLAQMRHRPWFATNSLPSHRRPHTPLPGLRATEHPNSRLAVRPLEETLDYVRDGDRNCCD
jgi:hypothetical protein